MKTYYFGCWRVPGHRMWKPNGACMRWDHTTASYHDIDIPWDKIDGTLNPSERQGEAAIHHKGRWTALAFADRSEDSRPGSNSVFFFEGILTFQQAKRAMHDYWPGITSRFEFEIKDTAV